MLPVPTLEDTCQLYLKSVQPYLKTKEARQRTETVVESFLQSDQARQLQERLLQRREQASDEL
jgi:carnitine O-acetyltransferase